MNKNWKWAACLLASLFCLHYAQAQHKSGYALSHVWHIKSTNWWDYLNVDETYNRLYVSHGDHVNVLNVHNGDSLGIIPDTKGVHGIAFAADLNKGFVSDGGANQVTVFDLKTLHVLGTVQTGGNPDAILYDPYSMRIYTCNGRSGNMSIIDPRTDRNVGTIQLDGKPETPASDQKGHLYVNIENKSLIDVVDLHTGKVIRRYPIAPGESPSGLAIDNKHGILFIGCDNKMMIAMDYHTGKVLKSIPTGAGCDGAGFDPGTGLAFSSNGEGTLSVIEEHGPDNIRLLENVPTKRGARTMALDLKTHTVYLSTSEFGAPKAGQRRPPMIPGTFQVLVVSRK